MNGGGGEAGRLCGVRLTGATRRGRQRWVGGNKKSIAAGLAWLECWWWWGGGWPIVCETNCSAAKRRAPRTNLTHSTHLTTAQLHSRAIRNSRWPMSAPAARRASPTSPPPATSAPCHWCVHLSIWIPAPGVFTRCVCLSLPLVCARPVVFYLCISLPLVCAHAVVFTLSIYTCIRYGWCNPPPQTKPKPPPPSLI